MQEATPATSTATLGPTRQSLQAATPTNSSATLQPERPLKSINIQEPSPDHLTTITNNDNNTTNNNDDDDSDNDDHNNDDNDDNDDGDSAEDRSYSGEDMDGVGDYLWFNRVISMTPQKKRRNTAALGVKHPFDRGRNAGAVELQRREEIAVPDCGGLKPAKGTC